MFSCLNSPSKNGQPKKVRFRMASSINRLVEASTKAMAATKWHLF